MSAAAAAEDKKPLTKIVLVKFKEGTSQAQIDDFFSSYVRLTDVTPIKSVVWGTNIGLPTSPSEGYNHTFYSTFDSLEYAKEFFAVLSSASSISTHLSAIPPLTGSNFKSWKGRVEVVLGVMDLDFAFRHDPPQPLTQDSTNDQKLYFEKWERSNRLSLMIMKEAIPETLRSGIKKEVTAKEFLLEMELRNAQEEKGEAGAVLSKLVSMRYLGKGNIREHILEMAHQVSKLRAFKLEISDDLLVHFVFLSLPAQYSKLKVSYNCQKEKWDLKELISHCVQEEERLKIEQPESAHMVTSKGKGKRKFKSKEVVGAPQFKGKEAAGAPHQGQKKQRSGPSCYFCQKDGHLKKDCPKYHAWRAKKGLPALPTAS